METPLDVLIVGAGISGIALGCELSKKDLTFTILDKRERFGGTWDIFTYPGVRSDSEMDSYRFSFKPWRGARPLGLGPEIQQYLTDAAREHGLHSVTQFKTRVTRANWNTDEQLWHVETSNGLYKARHLHIAGGYFNHEHGYVPDFSGASEFQGILIEPQNWPTDLNWAGKNIVVIGSGATAATLVPELAKTARVTMLQRSPSHMAAMPSIATKGPDKLERWRAIVLNQLIIAAANTLPTLTKKALSASRARVLPPEARPHFEPDYPVWDQRVCRIPDGDLFQLVASGEVEVVTDGVDKLTTRGVRTVSGRDIPADIIVCATGLQLQALGGIALEVDGCEVEPRPAYRGCMLHDVPSLTFTMGYVNESFTLRAELVAKFVADLVDFPGPVVPRGVPGPRRVPIIDLASTYVKRGIAAFPYVTDAEPYALHNNHFREACAFRRCAYEGLEFGLSYPAGVRAKLSGPEDGEVVVLLHGIGRSLEDFDRLDLPGKRVVALDIPGFGATNGLAQPTMAGCASALWRALDELGVTQATVVGNSLGGALAMRMALQRPYQVQRVVLLAPSGFSPNITSSVKIAASPLGRAFMALLKGPLLEKVERSLMREPKMVVARRNARRPDHARTFMALSRELVKVPESERMKVATDFGKLGIPTRVLWGDKDSILPVADADAVTGVIPHASVITIPGAGHLLQSDCPDQVRAAVVSWG